MRSGTSTNPPRKILFLGNANNPLLINLALELRKINPTISIDILSEVPVNHEGARTAFSAIYSIPAGKFFRSIPGLKTIWMAGQFRKTLKRIGKTYDVVHMFLMHVSYTRSQNLLKSIAPKFIVTVFGSELYRSSELILKELEPLARMAHHVTAANANTLRDFRKRFNVAESKTSICRFGLKPLDEILAQKNIGKAEHKRKAGLPEHSFVITCGYNASAGQQHEEMINSLTEVKQQLPENYLLVFPVAVGDLSRKPLIRKQLEASGLNHTFIEKFLPDDELAHFRAATDIMIQVQTTDQLSGAMQEHMYARNLVITGDWLPYEIMRETGVKYWTLSKVSEVGGKLCELMSHLESNRKAVENNDKCIWELSSWERNTVSWMALYE